MMPEFPLSVTNAVVLSEGVATARRFHLVTGWYFHQNTGLGQTQAVQNMNTVLFNENVTLNKIHSQ